MQRSDVPKDESGEMDPSAEGGGSDTCRHRTQDTGKMVCDRDAQDVQGEAAALSTMPTRIAFASFNAQVHLSRLIFRHITSLQGLLARWCW